MLPGSRAQFKQAPGEKGLLVWRGKVRFFLIYFLSLSLLKTGPTLNLFPNKIDKFNPMWFYPSGGGRRMVMTMFAEAAAQLRRRITSAVPNPTARGRWGATRSPGQLVPRLPRPNTSSSTEHCAEETVWVAKWLNSIFSVLAGLHRTILGPIIFLPFKIPTSVLKWLSSINMWNLWNMKKESWHSLT